MIARVEEATQMLHSVLHPVAAERDIRHTPEAKTMKYQSTADEPIMRQERVGVTHLVHSWYMQGHKASRRNISRRTDISNHVVAGEE